MIPLLYKYGFDGPVYSTPPATRDLSAMLQLDYIDVVNKDGGVAPPYSSREVQEYLKHSITLNFGSVTDIAPPDVKLTYHNAGTFWDRRSVISTWETVSITLRSPAISITTPPVSSARRPCSSPPSGDTLHGDTYGGSHDMQPSKKDAEQKLYDIVNTTINRGGKVVIPAFASDVPRK